MTIEEAIKHFETYIGNDFYTEKHQHACAMAISALREHNDHDHIQDLLQAEKEGRLIVLPLKTVWELTYDAGPDCDLKCPVSVDGIGCCDFCGKAKLIIYERPCTQERLERLGKSVFFTKEEAEAALAVK